MIFKSLVFIFLLTFQFCIYGAESSLKDNVGKIFLLLANSSSSKNSAGDSQQGVSTSVSKSPAEGAQQEIPESVFKLNKKEPQAKGIILAFKHWPLKKEEKELIREKTAKVGLKEKSEMERFKTWVFEWPKWHKAIEAEKICKEFSSLSFLDYCEPDYFLEPATGYIRKKVKKKIHKSISGHSRGGPKIPPKAGPKLNPPGVPANQTGDVRTCNIVASQLGLPGLSDYWAQERIGADLLKEELKKVSPVKKHLVAVFDSPYKYRHDMGVKNLISGEGKQAVLPPLGNNMTNFDVTISSHYLDQANHLLNKTRGVCGKSPAEKKREAELEELRERFKNISPGVSPGGPGGR